MKTDLLVRLFSLLNFLGYKSMEELLGIALTQKLAVILLQEER